MNAETEMVPLDRLKPWDKNPRKNDAAVSRVVKSIHKFGFANPILARRENGEIIAGHTRFKAAEILGLAEVPVRFLDLERLRLKRQVAKRFFRDASRIEICLREFAAVD